MDISRYHQRQYCALRAFRLRRKLAHIGLTFHRAWRRKRSPTSPPAGTTPLHEIPLEIMGSILDDLPLIAKACLALTCKSFFWLLGDVLSSPELHHPSNMVFDQDIFSSVRSNCLSSQRWALIQSLEEGNLLACSSCLKLHPFTEFRPNQILLSDHGSRVCHLGYYSGFVDLCPCLKLTFRNKLDLVDEWKRFLASRAPTPGVKFAWHYCSRSLMEDRVAQQTAIFPRFEVDGSLVLDIDYIFKFTGPTWVLKYLGRRVCPHHSMFDLVTFDIGCPLTAITRPVECTTNHRCPICKTAILLFQCWHSGSLTCMRVRVNRNLGNAEHVPDMAWYIQTSFSGDDVSLTYWYEPYEVSPTNPSLMNWDGPRMTRQRRRWESPVNGRSSVQIGSE